MKLPKDLVHFSELQWSSLGSLNHLVNFSEVPWGPCFSVYYSEVPGVLCLSVYYSKFTWGLFLSVYYSEVPWGPLSFGCITVKFAGVPVSFSVLQWSSLASLCLSVNYSEVPWSPLFFSAIPWSSYAHAGTYVCDQQGRPHRWDHTASCRYLEWHKQQACQITALAYVFRVVGKLIAQLYVCCIPTACDVISNSPFCPHSIFICPYYSHNKQLLFPIQNWPLGTALPLYRTGVSLLSRERFLYI